MKIKLTEKILTILLLLIAVGALTIHPAQEVSMSTLGGDKLDTLFNIVSYLILFYFLILYWKGFLYVITRSPLQFLLLAIVIFSLLWSEDLSSSLTYLRGLIRIYFLAIYLAMRYSLREQIKLIAWALGVAASLSIIFSAFVPGYIHESPELLGMWSGIYGHKNELGYMMAWSAGVFLHLALSGHRYRWLMWALCGISICLIILSRSTTSLTILLTMILLLPFYRSLKKTNYKLQVIMITSTLMFLMISSILLLNNAETVVGTSGKDLTFNGRSDLWDLVISKILERPWLGYGFSGFWTSNAASKLRATYDWASNAHNGFLELLLELGFLGFLTFAAGFVRFFAMALTRIISVAKKPEDYWPMQMLIIIVIVNFSEARLLTPSWNWLMYVTTSLSLTVEYQRNHKKILVN
ncbi:O-antigen ligase family protein [Nostoc sp. 'Peltigera malacea cyanobiont' DB3992]|uniref:O-antigen ligase family protein n=1 Tax=Nostoc sp. 'Peltigera malacea cyanobiont' DB3992 TaxID=1206980 RepID=UPI000C048F5A|nr:O-antigen ligase family protein [Nostoc sp. 'Peltigera malacea cyanobiont' DB3992]PHM11817.1 polymerase [Nostoc sp. 'Peltigera malacea cyanobiont' DB3992]